MDGNIGSVHYKVFLDGSALPSELKKINDTIKETLSQSAEKAAALPLIKPIVDESQLHKLNKTIQSKIDHIGVLNRTPIRPIIDDSAIKTLTNRLDGVSGKNIKFNFDSNNLASEIATSVEKGFKKSASSGNALGALFAPARSIGTGIAASVTRDLSKEFSKGFSRSIESAIADTFGSSSLIGETIGRSLSNAISGKIGTATKKEIKQLASDTLGTTEIARESGRNFANRERYIEKSAARSLPGINRQRQEVARQKEQQDIELQTIRASTATLGAKRPQIASTVSKNTDALFDAKLSGNTTTVAVAKKQLSDSRSLLATLDSMVADANVQSVQVEGKIAKLKQQRERYDKAINKLSPEVSPALQGIANKAAGRKVAKKDLPKIIAADKYLASQNAQATYSPVANQLVVTEQIQKEIATGKLSNASVMALTHEVRHGSDFDFGSVEGVRAFKRKQLLRPRKYSQEEIAYAAPKVEKYPEAVRDLEMSAFAAEYSVAPGIIVANAKSERTAHLNKTIGFGGEKFKKLSEGLISQAQADVVISQNREVAKVLVAIDAKNRKLIAKIQTAVGQGDVSPGLLEEASQQLSLVESIAAKAKASTIPAPTTRNRTTGASRREAKERQGAKPEKEQQGAKPEMAAISQEITIGQIANSFSQALGKIGKATVPLRKGISSSYQFAQGIEDAVLPFVPFGGAIKKIGSAVALPALAYGGLGALPGGQMLQGAMGAGARGLLSLPAGAISSVASGAIAEAAGGIPMIGQALTAALSTALSGGIESAVSLAAPVLAGKVVLNAAKMALPAADSSSRSTGKALADSAKKNLQITTTYSPLDDSALPFANRPLAIEGAKGGDVAAIKAAGKKLSAAYKKIDALIKQGSLDQALYLAANIDQATTELLAGSRGLLEDLKPNSADRNALISQMGNLGKKKKLANYKIRKIEQDLSESESLRSIAGGAGDDGAGDDGAEELASVRAALASRAKRGSRVKLSGLSKQFPDPWDQASAGRSRFTGAARRIQRDTRQQLAAEGAPGYEQWAQQPIAAAPSLAEEAQAANAQRQPTRYTRTRKALVKTAATPEIQEAVYAQERLSDRLKQFEKLSASQEAIIRNDELLNRFNGASNTTTSKYKSMAGAAGGLALSLFGAQAAFMALGAAGRSAFEGVGLALERSGIETTLRAVTASTKDFNTTVAASKATAKASGISETESLRGFSNLAAGFQDTALESDTPRLAAGVIKFAKYRGIENKDLKYGLLGVQQVGQKGVFQAEEANQITENLKGAGVELGAGSGISYKQLRQQLRYGSLDANVLISKFGQRLEAQSQVEEKDFLASPLAKVNAFNASIENLKAALGDQLLSPVAIGASVATIAVDGLKNSLELMVKVGVAGLALVGLKALGAVGGIELLAKAAASLNGLSVGGVIKSSGAGLVGVANSPLGKMAGELALITVGIEALGSLYQTFDRNFTGGNLPGRVARDRIVDGTRILNKQSGQEVTQATENEARNRKYDSQKNFGDRLQDTLGYIDPFALFLGNTGNDSAKNIEARNQGLQKETLKEGQSQLANLYLKEKPDTEKLANLRQKQLNLRSAEDADDGTDAVRLRKRTEEIGAISKEIADLEQPIQNTKAVIENSIKSLRDILDDKDISADTRAEALKQLIAYEAELSEVSKVLGAQTNATTRATLRARESAILYTAELQRIDRNSVDLATTVTKAFSGSLQAGLKATTEFDVNLSTSQARGRAINAATTRSEEQLKTLDATPYQQAGLLPQDLTTTTPEQLDRLKSIAKTNQQASLLEAEIRKRVELRDALATQQKDEASLIDSRKKAINEEAKATKDYYTTTILQLRQSRITSEQATQQFANANLTAKLKTAVDGLGTSTSSYVGSMVDIFVKSSEYVEIENNRRQKEYQLQLDRFNIQTGARDRDNASSDPQGLGGDIANPLGGSLENLERKIKSARPHERPEAGRRTDSGAPRRHNGIDLTGSAGDPAYAAVSGMARINPLQSRYAYQVVVTYVDDKGRRIDVEHNHLTRAGAEKALGIRVGQTIKVDAGQQIGNIADLGKIADPHVDLKYRINGVLQEDSDRFLLRSIDAQRRKRSSSRAEPASQAGRRLTSSREPAETGVVDEVLSTIGAVESQNRYDSPNQIGQAPLSRAEMYGGGFPARAGAGSNVGRWQFNKTDYEWARKIDPSITDYSPASQRKLAIVKLNMRAGKSLRAYIANPTLANAKKLRHDLGAEWEGLRDGKGDRYEGTDRRVNYWNRKDTDEQFHRRLQKALRQSSRADAGNDDQSLGELLAYDQSSVASDSPMPGLLAGSPRTTDRQQPTNLAVPKVLPIPIVKKAQDAPRVLPIPKVRRRQGGAKLPSPTSSVPDIEPTSNAPTSDNIPDTVADQSRDVYRQQLQENDRQRQENLENATTAAETLQINLQNQANAAARQKRRAEFETKKRDQAADRARRDRAESSKYQSPEDLKKVEARKLEEANQDEIDQLKMERQEAAEELREYNQLRKRLKKLDTSKMGATQKEQLLYLQETVIPDAVKYVNERLKIIDSAITTTDKSYVAAMNFLEQKYQDEEATRRNASNVKVSESRIAAMRAGLDRVNTLQKTSPFDVSQGDPLYIQSDIAKAELQNRYLTDKDALLAEERTANPFEKTNIAIRRERLQTTYNVALANIDNQLQKDLEARADEIQNFELNRKLELSDKSKEALNAALALTDSKDRLAPTYADQPVIDKNAVDRQDALDNYLRNTRKIESDAIKDQTEAGIAHAKNLKIQEDRRYALQLESLGASLKNDLILASVSRRQDELARKRALFQSGADLATAETNLSNAGGYTYQAALASQALAREDRKLKREESDAAINEFELKNPTKKSEANRRQLQLERESIFTEQAEKLRAEREREAVNFNLSQQLGGSYSNTKRSQASGLKFKGNLFDAASLEKEAALIEIALEKVSKIRDFEEQLKANEGDTNAVDRIKALREEYELLSQIKLDNTITEFSRFGNVIKDTTDQTGNIIGKLLTGQGTQGSDWNQLLIAPFRALSNTLGTYINSIINNLLEGAMRPITDYLDSVIGNAPSAKKASGGAGDWISAGIGLIGNLFGGGGGGASLFGGHTPRFADGGIVNPHLAPSPRDNRLAWVHDGEAFIPAKTVQAIGGTPVIDFILKNKSLPLLPAFNDGGIMGAASAGISSAVKSVSDRGYVPPMGSAAGQALTIEYRDIGGVPMVTVDQFEQAMAANNKQIQSQMVLQERQRRDAQRHSYAQRMSG